MTTLISKVQHNTFEIGEFVEEKQRNYEETIELIENFPWEPERKNLAVGLTNPSITIAGKNDDFLKLALFYNGKFVLHYFNRDQVLFTKSFTDIKSSYPFIKSFFEQDSFDVSDFKKENTWLQHNKQHFVSQDFHYTASSDAVKKFLISTSGFNLGASIFMIVFVIGDALLKANNNTNYFLLALILLIFIFLLGGGINLIIFFNFYNHVKNKILIMSRGSNVFYYGDVDNPKEYDKSEILRFRTIKIRASRSPINGFAITVLELKDGTELQIPNLLVDYVAMEYKLSGIPEIQENKTPFIRD